VVFSQISRKDGTIANQCLLELMGAAADAKKDLIAVVDG